MDHIVGAAEIAKRLGLASPQRVRSFANRYPDFPQPLKKLEMGNVWSWPAIEKWAKAHQRPVKPKDEWKKDPEPV